MERSAVLRCGCINLRKSLYENWCETCKLDTKENVWFDLEEGNVILLNNLSLVVFDSSKPTCPIVQKITLHFRNPLYDHDYGVNQYALYDAISMETSWKGYKWSSRAMKPIKTLEYVETILKYYNVRKIYFSRDVYDFLSSQIALRLLQNEPKLEANFVSYNCLQSNFLYRASCHNKKNLNFCKFCSLCVSIDMHISISKHLPNSRRVGQCWHIYDDQYFRYNLMRKVEERQICEI